MAAAHAELRAHGAPQLPLDTITVEPTPEGAKVKMTPSQADIPYTGVVGISAAQTEADLQVTQNAVAADRVLTEKADRIESGGERMRSAAAWIHSSAGQTSARLRRICGGRLSTNTLVLEAAPEVIDGDMVAVQTIYERLPNEPMIAEILCSTLLAAHLLEDFDGEAEPEPGETYLQAAERLRRDRGVPTQRSELVRATAEAALARPAPHPEDPEEDTEVQTATRGRREESQHKAARPGTPNSSPRATAATAKGGGKSGGGPEKGKVDGGSKNFRSRVAASVAAGLSKVAAAGAQVVPWPRGRSKDRRSGGGPQSRTSNDNQGATNSPVAVRSSSSLTRTGSSTKGGGIFTKKGYFDATSKRDKEVRKEEAESMARKGKAKPSGAALDHASTFPGHQLVAVAASLSIAPWKSLSVR